MDSGSAFFSSLFYTLSAFVVLLACFLPSATCLKCNCNFGSEECFENGGWETCQSRPGVRTVCFYRTAGTQRHGWNASAFSFRCAYVATTAEVIRGRHVEAYRIRCQMPPDPLNPYVRDRCCETDFCNHPSRILATLPVLPTLAADLANTNDVPESISSQRLETHIAIAVAVVGCFVCIGIALALVIYRLRSKKRPFQHAHAKVSESKLSICRPSSAKKPGVFVTEADSGFGDGDSSGRGVFQLEERTISREITLANRIGTGRFGEVYRGIWRGNEVAVKIFKTMDEASFFREVDLFNTNMLRHENILGFQAADNRDCSMETQLWMVLDYHSNGSLFDYLRAHTNPGSPSHSTLTLYNALTLASSTAAGLAHLHFRIGGTNGFQSLGHKPSIAHRDLKTKNILVKANGTCCIADLGMAVRDNPDYGDLKSITHANLQAGTRRYMAPEILSGNIQIDFFESFRRVDMYSLSIVLWEILSCCHLPDRKEPHYRFPFEEHVAGDPTVEEMHKVVCTGGYRPVIPEHWQDVEELKTVIRILRSCWRAEPASRLPAQNVSKKLQALRSYIIQKNVN